MKTAISLSDRPPTLDEYLQLADSVGWSDFVSRDTAAIAILNSLHWVVAMQGQSIVGMARVIGDRALFFYVQDVAVSPSCQGMGVGDALMRNVMGWLDGNAPDGAFVGLFSARGKSPFYERYGFRAAEGDRPGMSTYVRLPE